MKNQTAANNSFLAEIKQTWDAPVYRKVTEMLNNHGEMTARHHLGGISVAMAKEYERRLEFQMSMFGCSIDHIERPLRDSDMSAVTLSMSMISDAQGLTTSGHFNEARQKNNAAKYVIQKFLKVA